MQTQDGSCGVLPPPGDPADAPSIAMGLVYQAAGQTTDRQLANLEADQASALTIWNAATATSVAQILALAV